MFWSRHVPNLPAEKKGKIGPHKQAALRWQNRGVERKITLVGDLECVY